MRKSRPLLQLVVLRPGELVVRDEPVLVLVLVLEDLLDELVVLGDHVLDVLGLLATVSRHHLLLQVFADLKLRKVC